MWAFNIKSQNKVVQNKKHYNKEKKEKHGKNIII